jgi:hypothetical protein
MSAKVLRLEPDGSYIVHFLPPQKEQAQVAQPKNEYPPFRPGKSR